MFSHCYTFWFYDHERKVVQHPTSSRSRWSHKGLKPLLNKSLWSLLRSNPQDSNGILPCLNMHQYHGLYITRLIQEFKVTFPWLHSKFEINLGYLGYKRSYNKQTITQNNANWSYESFMKKHGRKTNIHICCKIKSNRIKF